MTIAYRLIRTTGEDSPMMTDVVVACPDCYAIVLEEWLTAHCTAAHGYDS